MSRLHQIKSELCIRSSPCSPSSNHYFDDFDDRGDDFDDGDNDGADGWRAGHVLWKPHGWSRPLDQPPLRGVFLEKDFVNCT